MRRLSSLLLALALAAVPLACSDAGGPSGRSAAVEVLSASDAVDLLTQDGVTVVDVRTPDEHADGHVAGARLLDVQSDDFEHRLAGLDRADVHVVYCRTGSRSARAAARMVELGFEQVYDAGGYADLAAAGAPVETGA